jgi:hypothetical protein
MLSFVASFRPCDTKLPGLPSRCSGPSWRAQMGSPLDRRFPHCSRLPQCRLEDRGLDRPSHVIIGYIMPLFGLELLDSARYVAAFNLPARVWQFFGASL